jgi:alpha-1,3-glucan synthase
MLSQLSKTIKLALRSTEEERAILRARSAVQRFPVIQWRQQMEDLHRRSITTSRNIAGSYAWRDSDCAGGGTAQVEEVDDWDPAHPVYPSLSAWDSGSLIGGNSGTYTGSSDLTPERSQDIIGRDHSFHPHDEDPDTSSHTRSGSNTLQDSSGPYNNFLHRANRAIARDHRHAPDPFIEGDSGNSQTFGAHSRSSSVESIASIVDEKSNSPLNKAIASVRSQFSGSLLYTETHSISLPMPMAAWLLNSFRSSRC